MIWPVTKVIIDITFYFLKVATSSDKITEITDDNSEKEVEEKSESPTAESPISETDENSVGSATGKPKHRPPPIFILNSNFSDNLGGDDGSKLNSEQQKNDATSPTASRKFLVKQSGVCDDSGQAKADSPKFLIPPGKFDSTPRYDNKFTTFNFYPSEILLNLKDCNYRYLFNSTST